MKKILQISTLIFLASCQIQNITYEEKENVITKLENMMKIDQEYAGIPPKELKEKYGNEKAWEIFQKKRDSVAIDNQTKAKELFEKYGFVGTKNFSKSASGNFWIIIQHADNDIKLQDIDSDLVETMRFFRNAGYVISFFCTSYFLWSLYNAGDALQYSVKNKT
jgi:hypothetical protein